MGNWFGLLGLLGSVGLGMEKKEGILGRVVVFVGRGEVVLVFGWSNWDLN